MAVIAFDFGHVPVFLFLLGNNIDTCGRGVGVTILSPLSSTAPGILLVVLILLRLGGRSLLSRRGLFATRRISRGGVIGLVLSTEVFLFLLSGLVPSRSSWVHVASTGGGLEHCFCLHIDGFLHGLFLGIQVPALGIHLGPDGRFQAFQEASDHDLLVWSCTRIKLLKDRLQVL